MAKDAPAPASKPADDGMGERDYAALLATLSASERGRAFLAEFARRQRAAETEKVLAALARLEEMIAAQRAPATAQSIPEQPMPSCEPHLVHLSVVAPRTEPNETEPPAAASAPVATSVTAAPATVGPESAPADIASELVPVAASTPTPAPTVTSASPTAAAASAPAPKPAASASLAEISWYEEEAPPADNGVRISIADDEPAAEAAGDRLETTVAEVNVAMADDKPEQPASVTDALEQPVLSLSDLPEEPTSPVSDLPDEPAPMSIARDEPPAAANALAPMAPPSAAEPQPLTPPAPGAPKQPAPSADHPLAQLMALTDEERIALFS